MKKPNFNFKFTFTLLSLIMLSIMSCSKDPAPHGLFPDTGGDVIPNDRYFKIDYNREFVSYGEIDLDGGMNSPYLQASIRIDSAGNTFTDIKIVVETSSRGVYGGSSSLGNVKVNTKLTKKGSGLVGSYTTKNTNPIYPGNEIEITDYSSNGFGGGIFSIDTTGLEFNITRASDSSRAFVEGNFKFFLTGSSNYRSSGTFKLNRY